MTPTVLFGIVGWLCLCWNRRPDLSSPPAIVVIITFVHDVVIIVVPEVRDTAFSESFPLTLIFFFSFEILFECV